MLYFAGTIRIRTYAECHHLVRVWGAGKLGNPLIVIGNGIGKSRAACYALEPLAEAKNFEIIHGHATAKQIFDTIEKNLNRPIILDDVEIWDNPLIISLLKHLSIGKVQWRGREIKTKSPLLILTNKQTFEKAKPEALSFINKCTIIDFDPSEKEIQDNMPNIKLP